VLMLIARTPSVGWVTRDRQSTGGNRMHLNLHKLGISMCWSLHIRASGMGVNAVVRQLRGAGCTGVPSKSANASLEDEPQLLYCWSTSSPHAGQ